MTERGSPAEARSVPLALGAAIASISFAAIFLRLATPTHPLVIAGTRLAIASLALAIPTARAIRAGRLSRRTVGSALACGVLYALHFGTWVTSLTMTSVAASVTLVTATPLLLALISLVTRRDRPELRHWVAIGLAMIGLSLIGWADLSFSSRALAGDAMAFTGALAMAFYLLIVRALGEELDVLAFGGLATGTGALVLTLAALIAGVPIAFASGESLFWIGMAALLPQLVGHTLLTWSLRHAKPTAVGIATVGEPVGSSLLAWIWLGERVTPVVAAGCAVTLAAVLVSLRRSGSLAGKWARTSYAIRPELSEVSLDALARSQTGWCAEGPTRDTLGAPMSAPSTRIDRADDGFALGTHANLAVIVWRKEPTHERLRAAAALVEKHAKATGGSVGVISVIEDGAPTPDPLGAEQVAVDVGKLAPSMWAIAIVVEASDPERVLDAGFVIDEARNAPMKQRYCADVREAAAWLAAQCPREARGAWTRDGLVAAVAQIRDAMGARGPRE